MPTIQILDQSENQPSQIEYELLVLLNSAEDDDDLFSMHDNKKPNNLLSLGYDLNVVSELVKKDLIYPLPMLGKSIVSHYGKKMISDTMDGINSVASTFSHLDLNYNNHLFTQFSSIIEHINKPYIDAMAGTRFFENILPNVIMPLTKMPSIEIPNWNGIPINTGIKDAVNTTNLPNFYEKIFQGSFGFENIINKSYLSSDVLLTQEMIEKIITAARHSRFLKSIPSQSKEKPMYLPFAIFNTSYSSTTSAYKAAKLVLNNTSLILRAAMKTQNNLRLIGNIEYYEFFTEALDSLKRDQFYSAQTSIQNIFFLLKETYFYPGYTDIWYPKRSRSIQKKDIEERMRLVVNDYGKEAANIALYSTLPLAATLALSTEDYYPSITPSRHGCQHIGGKYFSECNTWLFLLITTRIINSLLSGKSSSFSRSLVR